MRGKSLRRLWKMCEFESRKRGGDAVAPAFIQRSSSDKLLEDAPQYSTLGSQSASEGIRISKATSTKSATRNGSVPR